MNDTLISAFLRQRLTSPMRVGLILLLTVFPLGAAVVMNSPAALGAMAGSLALVLAAGAIGQDVSSGTLQLLLVRPVSRPSVVVHRWLASVIGAMGITLATLVLATFALFARGTHPDALDLVRIVLENTCSAVGSAAVMIMLSTLVGGLGDVGLYAATLVFAQLLIGLGTVEHWDVLVHLCTQLQGVLSPQLSWEWMTHHMPPSWYPITSWASTVTLALALGIARLNRRELSYAAG